MTMSRTSVASAWIALSRAAAIAFMESCWELIADDPTCGIGPSARTI
jgi:hypothetical protein